MRGNLKGTQSRRQQQLQLQQSAVGNGTSSTNSNPGFSTLPRFVAIFLLLAILSVLAALIVLNVHITPEGDHLEFTNFNSAVKYANQFVHNHSFSSYPHFAAHHKHHRYNAHLHSIPLQHSSMHLKATAVAPATKTPLIAYVFAGSARSFVCPKVHWSIKANLLDSLGGEAHTFVRISAEDNQNVKTGTGTLWNPQYKQKELDETLKLLNPRMVTWFSFADQEREMRTNYPSSIHRVFRENDQRRYSMFFHRCMAYKMVLQYEQQHALKFDWVVLARLDAAWLDPILPIQAYASDRVWLTETGYDRFNDQFMLIPRQFSDYVYDLNTKVVKGVYCLGGPDVEAWKCNSTSLSLRGYESSNAANILDNCCPDILKSGPSGQKNTIGRSERIHYRHLRAGKVPIGIGRFPVFLTRRTKWKECHSECFRIYAYHYKEYVFRFESAIYPYLMPPLWPDTRGRSISSRDRSLCYFMSKEVTFPWNPATAASIHTVTAGLGDEAEGKAGSEQARKISHLVAGLQSTNETFAGAANRHRKHADYSKRLVDQREFLHPSILLNNKYLEVWRIQPTWNIEGCLTFKFDTKTAGWEMCKGHSKLKNIRYDPRQLFFLNVIPSRNMGLELDIPGYHLPNRFPESTYGTDVSNVTRLVAVNGDMKTFDHRPQIYCLTAAAIQSNAAVDFEHCNNGDPMDPKQLFYTVRGISDGSHPLTTTGQLVLVADPSLCVARQENTMKQSSVIPDGDKLFLFKCAWGAHAHRNTFEFELITS